MLVGVDGVEEIVPCALACASGGLLTARRPLAAVEKIRSGKTPGQADVRGERTVLLPQRDAVRGRAATAGASEQRGARLDAGRVHTSNLCWGQ